MPLVEVRILVPEEYAETAVAYALEHIGIRMSEQLAVAALAPVEDAVAVALEELRVANTPEAIVDANPE